MSLGNLKNLIYLNFNNNLIKELRESLPDLKAIKMLEPRESSFLKDFKDNDKKNLKNSAAEKILALEPLIIHSENFIHR